MEKDWQKSIELCQEVIKSAPFVPDTYTLLAMCYNEMGDLQKSLHYRKLESVCLPKANVDWVQLGQCTAYSTACSAAHSAALQHCMQCSVQRRTTIAAHATAASLFA